MRLALISDIHGNLPALDAALKAIRPHAPDQIVSLGDQVNLGPCPREVLDLLKAEGVTCLHGNHERYILSAMAGDPAYCGANFHFLRYHAAILAPQDITFPREMRVGSVLLTHAMPGDDRFPVFHVKQCMERLRAMSFPEETHIFCGHGHNPKVYRAGNLTLQVIGSTGCMDDGIPGTAPFTIVDIENDYVCAQPYCAAYDQRQLPKLYRRSGMVDCCPIMARVACLESTRNREYLLGFVALAGAISKERGELHISEESWREADRRFPWPDGISTAAFWAGV